MKILVTCHQFLPEYSSGTELIAYYLAKELQARGHTVKVLTSRPSDAQPYAQMQVDTYVYDGLDVVRFWQCEDRHADQRNPFAARYNHRQFGEWFRAFLAREQPDVVHFVHLARLSGSAIEACVERGVPTVFTATDFWAVCPTSQLRLSDGSMCAGPSHNAVNCIRHLVELSQPPRVVAMVRRVPNGLMSATVRAIRRGWFRGKWYAGLVQATAERPGWLLSQFAKVDRVLTPSHTMQEVLCKNGFRQSQMLYLPYGIQVQHIQRWVGKGGDEPLRVVFIGQIAEHKGCHVLVKALRLLAPDVRVNVKLYGDLTREAAYVESLRSIAGNDPRIEFAGRFTNTRVSQVLGAADVLVCPSLWYENTPLVIYEAMAAGVPVVASDLPGMAEAIKPEVNGALFHTGDAADLARVLTRLAGDRSLVARWAAQTEPPLSVSAHVTELERIYGELLVEKGRPAMQGRA